MRHRILHRALLILALALVGTPEVRADTRVAEEVLARVDGRPVLLSEVRARARGRLREIAQGTRSLSRTTETQKVYAEALEARIEEEIVKTIASTLHITVDGAEVSRTITTIATSQKITAEELLAAVLVQGWTQAEYREVIRVAVVRQRVIYTLGLRDKSAGAYPSSEEERAAWLLHVENGAFAREKSKACVERFVRW